jgi:hypothetical protein|tara:strand:- start:433 stop:642 length:210 start_codon:yes stop_codon:yes gene_type:complete
MQIGFIIYYLLLHFRFVILSLKSFYTLLETKKDSKELNLFQREPLLIMIRKTRKRKKENNKITKISTNV